MTGIFLLIGRFVSNPSRTGESLPSRVVSKHKSKKDNQSPDSRNRTSPFRKIYFSHIQLLHPGFIGINPEPRPPSWFIKNSCRPRKTTLRRDGQFRPWPLIPDHVPRETLLAVKWQGEIKIKNKNGIYMNRIEFPMGPNQPFGELEDSRSLVEA